MGFLPNYNSNTGGVNMSTISIVLSAVFIILSVILCGIILLQSKRSAGLGAISASGSGGDTYWSKNKGNSMEGALEKYTKILGALFMILAFVINLVA